MVITAAMLLLLSILFYVTTFFLEDTFGLACFCILELMLFKGKIAVAQAISAIAIHFSCSNQKMQ